MLMSACTRADRRAGAVALLSGGTTSTNEASIPAEYAFGRAEARVSRPGLVVGVVGAALAVALVSTVSWGFVIVGLLALVYAWNTTRPVRGILVTPAGITVVAMSVHRWHARTVLARLPVAVLPRTPLIGGGRTTIPLGAERLTFGADEYRRLFDAARAVTGVPVA